MKQKTASESNDFANYVLDLLAPLGPCTARKMFGGYGIHLDDLNFAIIIYDQLGLKVDSENHAMFEGAGCQPFIYEAKGRSIPMSYWSVPAEAMESPAEMLPWARLAHAAALRAAAKKAAAKKPASKNPPKTATGKKLAAKKAVAKKATAKTPITKKAVARKTKAAKKAVTKKASKRT